MKKLYMMFALMILAFSVSACGPMLTEKFVEIAPNETAFLIPLEGASKTDQTAFMSVDYLNEAKIASKRISIPQRRRETGRLWWEYEWIPTMSVIKVDRSPVTREWTSSGDGGTSNKDQAIWVESKDSIGFGVGVNITGMIKEEDASTFLYFFAGKKLATILDENVRGKINSILAREFANHNLEAARSKKNEVFEVAYKATVEEFAARGITITNLGLTEGLVYEDEEIQQSINDKFTAEMRIQVEDQKNLAQERINARNVGIARAEADAAKEFAKAIAERQKQVQLEIDKMNAEARLIFAKNIVPGVLPQNILPEGSPLLMGLDTK